MTAYIYDWNMLPIGQLLWLKELMSCKGLPPLQAPETYNLDGILKQIQEARTKGDQGDVPWTMTYRGGRPERVACDMLERCAR